MKYDGSPGVDEFYICFRCIFMMRKYKVVLQPDEDGGYNVVVVGLPGCFTQGETKKEALENAREAIECHLAALQDSGVNLSAMPKASLGVVSIP
jgi:predicted RNase H-like HicB family nuclease